MVERECWYVWHFLGGFNSIQLAMRNPPALKAIIAIDATEELFHDDVHFIDGMMHIDEYELNVDLTMAVTRSPDFPTDEASLAARFDRPPWILIYKQHPRAGDFWDEPVRPLSDIKVPVFMIGGMLDGYRDSIPRLLAGIRAPSKALLGPWNHNEPTTPCPVQPLSGAIRRSSGGIIGYEVVPMGPCRDRSSPYT